MAITSSEFFKRAKSGDLPSGVWVGVHHDGPPHVVAYEPNGSDPACPLTLCDFDGEDAAEVVLLAMEAFGIPGEHV